MSDATGHIPSGERRAWLLLTAILLLVAGIHSIFRPAQNSKPAPEHELKLIHNLKIASADSFKSFTAKNEASPSLKPRLFNPNSISREEMRKMGFPEKLIRGIIGYREKVGLFRTKEDFFRIYTLNPALRQELTPYIDLPDSEIKNDTFSKTAIVEEKRMPGTIASKVLELNACDSADLIKLKGIGPYYAHIILKYRKSLGGYHHLSQLQEIRRLPDSVYLRVSPLLTVNPSLIRRLHINTLDEQSLSKHPYINRNQARALINYRSQHGPFKSAEDLRKIILLDEDFIQKIAPYIRWD